VLRSIIPPITGIEKQSMDLKSLMILSRPTRKPCFLTSLAVAVYSFLMVKKWQSSAAERLSEMTPKERMNIGVHLIALTMG